MNRLLTALIASGLSLAMAAPVHAAENDTADAAVDVSTNGSRPGGVTLLTSTSGSIEAGRSAWIALNWTALGGEASSFRVVADAPDGIEVGYPSNTGDHSSLYWDDVLSDAEVDFNALKLTIPAGLDAKTAQLRLRVTYVWNGKQQSKSFGVTVPIEPGAPVGTIKALTDHVGTIDQGASRWVVLEYSAVEGAIEDVWVTIDGPTLGAVRYPADGTASGLANGSPLDVGETDHVAFQLDTTGMEPGEHSFRVNVRHAGGEVQHTVGVTVSAGSTGTPVAIGPAEKGMQLTSMCWADDTHRMRVRNPNDVAVAYTWRVIGVDGTNAAVAQPGDNFFEFSKDSRSATVKIEWVDGNDRTRSQVKAVNRNDC